MTPSTSIRARLGLYLPGLFVFYSPDCFNFSCTDCHSVSRKLHISFCFYTITYAVSSSWNPQFFFFLCLIDTFLSLGLGLNAFLVHRLGRSHFCELPSYLDQKFLLKPVLLHRYLHSCNYVLIKKKTLNHHLSHQKYKLIDSVGYVQQCYIWIISMIGIK